MDSVLIIGGTRFVGRHAVEEFLDHDYTVTTFNRGNHENPFADDPRVRHVRGDRSDDERLLAAKRDVAPDVVVDCVAYFPEEVRRATEIFADVDAYVYVSSGAAYGDDDIPKREGVTRLCDCSADEAVTDSAETYGPRKAEGDRVVFSAAERGVNAMSVRPTVVYGPHDYTERFDYWLHRVDEYGRVIVPGDGTNVWQRVYVEDVARAIRVVAEEGETGEAYNVGDQNALTLRDTVAAVASALDARVDPVYASARELSTVDLELTDFPMYRASPHILDTHKLASLGWASTPVREAMRKTVAEHRESDRTGVSEGPGREVEERLLGVLDAV